MAKDKYKINLSYYTYNELIHDIYRYNFFKPNGTLNKNKFYNTLIDIFYNNYKLKREYLTEYIMNNYNYKFKNKNELIKYSNDIFNKTNEINHSDLDTHYHNFSIYIYPTKETSKIYDEIEANELKNQSISEFIRNIFNQYLCLVGAKREEMLYQEIYNFIEEQIYNKRLITITLISGDKIKVKPLIIISNIEETHNYLVGVNLSSKTEQLFSVKLVKIASITRHDQYFKFSNEELNKYREMLSEGPDFIAKEKQNATVMFDKEGIKMFEYCYKDRPFVSNYDDKSGIYKFNTDINKLYLYLLQFGKHVKVIEPLSLKDKLNTFHKEAIID